MWKGFSIIHVHLLTIIVYLSVTLMSMQLSEWYAMIFDKTVEKRFSGPTNIAILFTHQQFRPPTPDQCCSAAEKKAV